MDRKSTFAKKALQFSQVISSRNMGELDQDIGFSSNIFMMFGLPTRRYTKQSLIKENKVYKLILTQLNPDFEIPWGCYARLNQIFIDSQIVQNNSNLIELGNSFNEYVERLGYKEGRANRALKKQLGNLLRMGISLSLKTRKWDAGVQALVGDKWCISLDEKSPDQQSLFKSQILVSEPYARYVSDHAVPLDMDVVKFFKRNPLALDFYRFLAYRSHKLERPIQFPDRALFDQLGTEDKQFKKTRHRLKKILSQVQTFWPVRAKFENERFFLSHSPPAVQKKFPSRRTISIVRTLESPIVDN